MYNAGIRITLNPENSEALQNDIQMPKTLSLVHSICTCHGKCKGKFIPVLN